MPKNAPTGFLIVKRQVDYLPITLLPEIHPGGKIKLYDC